MTSLGGSPELAARQVLTRALEHVVGSTVNVPSNRPWSWDHQVCGFKSWFADWHCRLVFFKKATSVIPHHSPRALTPWPWNIRRCTDFQQPSAIDSDIACCGNARWVTTEWRTEAAESNQSLVSAKLLMCSFRSSFALKSQLLQDFQNALPQPQLATFVSKVSKNFADTAMCSAVAPALTGFVFAWEKRSAHYWQTFAVHFPQVGDIKTLLSNLQSARALSEEPLREAPPKNQDIPETESNQSLVSAKLLMCSFRSSFALKSQLLQDFQNALPQPQLATFVSKVSKNFADTAMCSAVAPALTGFVFAWEKRSPTVVDQVSLTGTAKLFAMDAWEPCSGSKDLVFSYSFAAWMGVPLQVLHRKSLTDECSVVSCFVPWSATVLTTCLNARMRSIFERREPVTRFGSAKKCFQFLNSSHLTRRFALSDVVGRRYAELRT